MTTAQLTVEAIEPAVKKAFIAAVAAGQASYEEIGERDCCGFAWASVFGIKLNTKIGKEFARLGFSKDYNGGISIWDPAHLPTQSMTPKEVGARAFAEVLRKELGVEAYMGSRVD